MSTPTPPSAALREATGAVLAVDDGQSQVVLNPQFVLRVCGLPIDLVDELRFPEAATWMQKVLALEGRLDGYRTTLTSVLEEALARTEDRKLRSRVLNLKRNTFNLRLQRAGEALLGIPDVLRPGEALLFEAAASVWKDYQGALAAYREVFERELRQKRKCLKKTVRRADFRKGILLASPSLDDAIDPFCDADHPQPSSETDSPSVLSWSTCSARPARPAPSARLPRFASVHSAGRVATSLTSPTRSRISRSEAIPG